MTVTVLEGCLQKTQLYHISAVLTRPRPSGRLRVADVWQQWRGCPFTQRPNPQTPLITPVSARFFSVMITRSPIAHQAQR